MNSKISKLQLYSSFLIRSDEEDEDDDEEEEEW
jgi:hypothetical protein